MTRQQATSVSVTALWASAFVIAALTVMQAGRLGGSPAYAEMTSDQGDYVLLTARSGRGDEAEPDEVLFIIDNREQMLLVYEIEDAQRALIAAREGGSLVNLFRNARPR